MYEIPPTALTNNLATALRAVFFHISTHIRGKHPAIVGLVASIASVIAIATKSIASATRCRCAYMR